MRPSYGLCFTHDLACRQGADLRLQISGTVLKLVGHSENEEIRDEIGGTLSRLAASLNGFRRVRNDE